MPELTGIRLAGVVGVALLGLAAVGLAAALGVDADWEGVLASAACAGLVGVALTEPVRRTGERHSLGLSRPWALTAAATAILLAGGVAVGSTVAREDARWLLLVAPVLATLAVGLPRWVARDWSVWELAVTAAAAMFPIACLTLAGWLSSRHPLRGVDASNATQAAGLMFDCIVLAVIRERFGGLVRREQAGASEDLERHTRGIWVQIAALGVAGVLALLTLWATAARGLGTNRFSRETDLDLTSLAVGAGCALAIAAAAWAIAVARRPPATAALHMEPLSAGLAVVAAAGWVAILAAEFDAPLHSWLAASVLGLLLGGLVAEDLVSNPGQLQLLYVPKRVYAVAIVVGGAAGFALFWVIARGLWAAGGPVDTGDSLLIAVLVILATAALATVVGATISRWSDATWLTLHGPVSNTVQDQILYAALALVGAVLPAFGVGRLSVTEVHNSGLVTVASAATLPAFIFMYIWVIQQNANHARSERHRDVSAVLKERANRSNEPLSTLERLRMERLLPHTWWQGLASAALVIVGYVWLAAVAFF
jgi:hypothetical protein